MKLELKRETIYGAGMARGRSQRWFARLDGEVIASDKNKADAEHFAYATLLEAYRNLTNTSAVRVAKDATVIVVRVVGTRSAMVEYNRDGKTGSTTIGSMSNGCTTFRDVQEYADYLLSRYNGAL